VIDISEDRYRELDECVLGSSLQLYEPIGYEAEYKSYRDVDSADRYVPYRWLLSLAPIRLHLNGLMPTVFGWIDSSASIGQPVIGVVGFDEPEAREVLWWMMQDEHSVREFARTARKEFKPRAFVAEINVGKLHLHIPHPAWSWQRVAW
jgi:hypothetical protein